MEDVRENKMGTAPMFGLILGMSLPAMFSMLIQALYNIVDSIFVSNYSNEFVTGNDSLLSVNIAYPMQMVLMSVAVGSGVGVGSLIARRLGAKLQRDADSTTTHGFFISIVDWIIFVVIGLLLVKPFVGLYTSEEHIVSNSVSYLSIVLIGSLGVNMACMMEKMLQATGNMIMPMLSQLIGAVINIALDPVFIYSFDLGVTGAAIATIIAQHISALLCLFFFFFKKQQVKIDIKNFKFSGITLKNIYVVAIPAMVMQAIGSFMIMALNYIISIANETTKVKDAATNVFGIYFKLQSFVFMPVFGLNQGSTPVIGYNYGAGNKKRMYSALKWAAIFAVIIMSLGFAVFQIFPEALLSMFDPSAEMIEIGTVALRIISLCFIPAAIGVILTGLFQAVGKGFRSLAMSLLRQMGVIVPVAYFLSQTGIINMWYAFPIAEGVALIIALLFFLNLVRGDFRRLEPRV